MVISKENVTIWKRNLFWVAELELILCYSTRLDDAETISWDNKAELMVSDFNNVLRKA